MLVTTTVGHAVLDVIDDATCTGQHGIDIMAYARLNR